MKPKMKPYETAIDVYHWPEFIDFANRLGIPVEFLNCCPIKPRNMKLTITLDIGELVQVAYDYGSDGHLIKPKMYEAAIDVYHWPEFIAFANRLGIPHEALTTKLTITLDEDGMATVAHEYHGADRHLPIKAEFCVENTTRRCVKSGGISFEC